MDAVSGAITATSELETCSKRVDCDPSGPLRGVGESGPHNTQMPFAWPGAKVAQPARRGFEALSGFRARRRCASLGTLPASPETVSPFIAGTPEIEP